MGMLLIAVLVIALCFMLMNQTRVFTEEPTSQNGNQNFSNQQREWSDSKPKYYALDCLECNTPLTWNDVYRGEGSEKGPDTFEDHSLHNMDCNNGEYAGGSSLRCKFCDSSDLKRR